MTWAQITKYVEDLLKDGDDCKVVTTFDNSVPGSFLDLPSSLDKWRSFLKP